MFLLCYFSIYCYFFVYSTVTSVGVRFTLATMKKSTRGCINHPDTFCYICGEFTTRKQRRPISKRLKISYGMYFKCQLGDQDKKWAPHITCTRCNSKLTQWLNGKNEHLPFAIPMVWREPKNHVDDCYFCLTNVNGFSSKNKKHIEYPNVPSAIRPIPHAQDLPVPTPPSTWEEIPDDGSMSTNSESAQFQSSGEEHNLEEGPHLIKQAELNDLVRDLFLSKEQSELLASRLKEWNVLNEETKVTYFRGRNKDLMTYYSSVESICACVDVSGLMKALDIQYLDEEWRLFVDASKEALKLCCYIMVTSCHLYLWVILCQ